MTREQARETARDILQIIPLVMRTVAAELRAGGELPATVHFGLLSMLSERPRMLTELAALQGVSLPTMSSSISTMVEHGWVRRGAPEDDRRIVLIEVTTAGRAALDRVARSAESHLAEVLAPLDVTARRRLHRGLGVLLKVFASERTVRQGKAAEHRSRGGRIYRK
jgi:DNA-binding MarR family transcriptional regulator